MTTKIKKQDKIVELLEEYACNPDDYDIYKFADEIRKQVHKEDEYRRLGAEQAHQEYELTKRPWWAR